MMADDPVLKRFRAGLERLFPGRLERVVLFGSRARGDMQADSDYDVAVFLRDKGGLWEELGLLAGLEAEILNDTGAVISAKPLPAGSYEERTPLMHEIRKDGIDL